MSYAAVRLLPAVGWERGRAFLSTRLAMIVAESSARSNLFLPVRGISRRGGIFIYGD